MKAKPVACPEALRATPILNLPPSVPRSVNRKLIANTDPEASASATPRMPIDVERKLRVFIEAPFPRRQVCRLLTVGSDT